AAQSGRDAGRALRDRGEHGRDADGGDAERERGGVRIGGVGGGDVRGGAPVRPADAAAGGVSRWATFGRWPARCRSRRRRGYSTRRRSAATRRGSTWWPTGWGSTRRARST